MREPSKNRLIPLILALVIASAPALYAAREPTRAEKVDQFLESIDAEHLAIALLDSLFDGMMEQVDASLGSDDDQMGELDPESRAEMRKEMEEFRKKQARFRDLLRQNIDGREIVEKMIRPIVDETFTEKELDDLIRFSESDAGLKFSEILPKLTIGVLVRSNEILQPAMQKAQEVMAEEDRASRKPWELTMADMRTIATATEAYAIDNDAYPDVSSIEALASLLEPTYVRKLPRRDGWGHEYAFVSSDDRAHYRIVSAGPDGQMAWDSEHDLDASQLARPVAPTTTANDDYIYQDGQFLAYPPESREKSDS